MGKWINQKWVEDTEKEEIPLNAKGEETGGWMSEARIKRGKHLPLPSDMSDDALDYFVETFEMYWEQGKSAKEIFKELQFDELELKPHHVYYFAKQLGLPKRHKHPDKKQQSID